MKHRCVLLVEGDPVAREAVRAALAADGVDCELAASGSEAHKAVEDPRLACLLFDVRGRDPDALALLEALRRQRPALRAIALAGPDDAARVLEALRRGACDYLAKPIHAEELRLAVRRALAGHAVETRWRAAREGLARLAERAREIAGAADAGDSRRALGERLVAAFGEALDAMLGAAEEAGGDAPFGDTALAPLGALAERVACWLEEPDAAAAPAAPAAAAPAAYGEADAELLREICDGMTREIEPQRLLCASLRPLARAAAARVASVLLIDNQSGRLVCEAQWSGSDVERAELPRDAGLTGASLQAGAIVAADHPERDPRFDPEVDTPESGVTGPLLVVPLRVRERVLGVARVFPAAEAGAPARLAELVAAPLSAATRNVLLYRSLLESVEDVARARREAEDRHSS